MQCLPEALGVESYWIAITLTVGAVMRLAKTVPAIKGDYLPAMAFALGWAIDGAMGNLGCGESYTEAALSAVAGGAAGLLAAGGHEAFVRTARSVGWEKQAEWLLGKADEQKAKETAK